MSQGTEKKIFQGVEIRMKSEFYMSPSCTQLLSLFKFQFKAEEENMMLWKVVYANYKTIGGGGGKKDRERVYLCVKTAHMYTM